MSSQRRSKARQEAAELHRREQERAKRRRRTNILVGGVVALAVIAGLVFLAVRPNSADAFQPVALPNSVTTPKGLVDGAVVSGNKDAKATVVLYEDLQCPACKGFEETTGPTLKELVDKGEVRLERRPLAFLDRFSTTNYSTRALNALGCVLETKPAVANAYMTALFAQQPAEGSAGLPDEQLTKIAADSGAPGIGSCVKDRTFEPWVKAMTQAGTETGVDKTPTVVVGGKLLPNPTPEALRAAVKAASA